MNHKKVLEGKKAGDKYNVISAPEEFHYWTRNKGWSEENLRNYGVRFIKLYFHGSAIQSTVRKEKFTKKTPRRFNNGEIDHGSVNSFTQTDLLFSIFYSDTYRINKLLQEICEIYNMPNLLVKSIEVQNLETNSLLFFKRFNPDHMGRSLYCESANGKNYTHFKYLREKVGKFKGIEADCRLVLPPPELMPVCAITYK